MPRRRRPFRVHAVTPTVLAGARVGPEVDSGIHGIPFRRRRVSTSRGVSHPHVGRPLTDRQTHFLWYPLTTTFLPAGQ